MLQPLGKYLAGRESSVGEADLRYFIERWLKAELKEEALWCESVSGGAAVVRVSNSAYAQAVYLLEYDLAQALHVGSGYTLKSIKVIQQS